MAASRRNQSAKPTAACDAGGGGLELMVRGSGGLQGVPGVLRIPLWNIESPFESHGGGGPGKLVPNAEQGRADALMRPLACGGSESPQKGRECFQRKGTWCNEKSKPCRNADETGKKRLAWLVNSATHKGVSCLGGPKMVVSLKRTTNKGYPERHTYKEV